MSRRIALITGATGQDGAYLAHFLLRREYEVHGVKRRSSSFNTGRVDDLYRDPHEEGDIRFRLHYGDMTDATNLIRLVQQIQPDEIYNLAAQSHVQVSFETAALAANLRAVLEELERAKPSSAKGRYFKRVVVASTMGPSIQLDTQRMLVLDETPT